MTDYIKNSNLLQAWLVLLLASCFGAALAGVQVSLGPKIEANKIAETMEKIPGVILGQEKAEELAQAGQTLDISESMLKVDKKGIQKFYPVYEAKFEDGTPAGLVAKASGQGYADRIELLVGLDSTLSKITGLFILDQKETPGLGNKIVEQPWLAQFNGKDAGVPLKVVKGGNAAAHDIDAVSGATISSRSVTRIINQTVSDVRSSWGSVESTPQKGEQ